MKLSHYNYLYFLVANRPGYYTDKVVHPKFSIADILGLSSMEAIASSFAASNSLLQQQQQQQQHLSKPTSTSPKLDSKKQRSLNQVNFQKAGQLRQNIFLFCFQSYNHLAEINKFWIAKI